MQGCFFLFEGTSRLLLVSVGLLLFGLGSCNRIEIEQGNYLTADQVQRIQKGQRRAQVHRILGEPLIQDPFHPQRWDYAYWRLSKDGELTRRRLTVFFRNGRVKRIIRQGGAFPKGYAPTISQSS